MPAWTRIGATAIDWVICGGESGPHARPMHPDWARSLRDECSAAGVPFLFKQWGEHDLSYDRDRDDPDYRRCAEMARRPGRWINLAGGHGFNGARVHYAHRVGKKAAGRQLDGREWNGFPRGRR
jgi:protein gp37